MHIYLIKYTGKGIGGRQVHVADGNDEIISIAIWIAWNIVQYQTQLLQKQKIERQ
jgi:hypothetical protein